MSNYPNLTRTAMRALVSALAALSLLTQPLLAQTRHTSATGTLDLQVDLPNINAVRRVSVGDTVTMQPVLCIMRGDVSTCKQITANECPTYAWVSSDTCVLQFGSARHIVARRPGDAQITVSGHAQTASAEFIVLPRVASFQWEPTTRVVRTSDTLKLAAIGRDERGQIVARVPLSDVALPSLHSLEVAGWNDTSGVLIWGKPGEEIVLHAYLGHRDVIAHIRARP